MNLRVLTSRLSHIREKSGSTLRLSGCYSCLRLCHDLPSSPGKCSYWPPKYCDWLWRSWAAILIGSLYHSLSAGGERGPGMRRSSWLDNLIAYWVDGCLPDTVTRNLSEQQKEDFFRAVTAPTTQPIPSDFSKLKLSDIALSVCVCVCLTVLTQLIPELPALVRHARALLSP